MDGFSYLKSGGIAHFFPARKCCDQLLVGPLGVDIRGMLGENRPYKAAKRVVVRYPFRFAIGNCKQVIDSLKMGRRNDGCGHSASLAKALINRQPHYATLLDLEATLF